jgi:hypothetical protein
MDVYRSASICRSLVSFSSPYFSSALGSFTSTLAEDSRQLELLYLLLTVFSVASIVPPLRIFHSAPFSRSGVKIRICGALGGRNSVAIGNAGLAARFEKEASTSKQFKTFLGGYFYLCMSLVLAAVVILGFSRTVDANLFHGNPPRPLLLWIHGAAFSTWVAFFIAQSALVRARRVSVHRLLGWFGTGLAAVMVILGFTIAAVMARFDTFVLRQQDVASFMSVPFADMILFGSCIALAIYWRKNPEYHRRLVFIATCQLMDAPFGRFDFMFNHSLFYPGLDCLIALGMVRDWVVDKRVHKVYLYALPSLIVVQSLAVYLWKINPKWWQAITQAIMGR